MSAASSSMGRVLVTGGAKRIGRAICLEMARAGWDVAIHVNRSSVDAQTLKNDIETLGRKAVIVAADFLQERPVADLIPALTQSFGPLTALVNNACLFDRNPDDPDGTRHKAVNALAPQTLTRALASALPAGQIGAVVNLLDATATPDFLSAYADSKALLAEATLDLARQLAPNVRVCAVAPGPCLPAPRQSAAHFDGLVAQTLLKIPTGPQMVASAVRFLIENAGMTGVILPVDAGLHLCPSKAAFLSNFGKLGRPSP